MSNSIIKVSLKNQLSEVKRLGDAVEHFSASNGLSAMLKFEINLVLDEIITNIISYGYNDNKEHHIDITMTTADDEFKAVIEDDGTPFNPLEQEQRQIKTGNTIEEVKAGGLGLLLVRNLADKIEYQRANDKNILTVSKSIEQ
jgi:anti-sigma regulatory factor (Ser/Thr protein kinase)